MSNKTLCSRWILRGLGLAWVVCVATGLKISMDYDSAAGAAADAPASWPVNLPFARNEQGCTLVMMAHPDCPCTYATIAELNRILSKHPDQLKAYILFSRPGSIEAEIQASPLWENAKQVCDAVLIADRDGALTGRFGGKTSGQTLLYDRSGALVFSGGITGSRGHEGDNVGRSAIEQAAGGKRIGFVRTPVFGCSLYDPASDIYQELRP